MAGVEGQGLGVRDQGFEGVGLMKKSWYFGLGIFICFLTLGMGNMGERGVKAKVVMGYLSFANIRIEVQDIKKITMERGKALNN